MIRTGCGRLFSLIYAIKGSGGVVLPVSSRIAP
jgi:hypothetical protein